RNLVIGKVRIDPTNIIEDLSSNIPWRSCQFPFRHVSEIGERVSSRSILKDGLKRTTTNLKNITTIVISGIFHHFDGHDTIRTVHGQAGASGEKSTHLRR